MASSGAKAAAVEGDSSGEQRKICLNWADYFMGVALISAQRSKDPITQVGACIVKKKRIVGVGYNGFPKGCSDTDTLFPWAKNEKDKVNSKELYVVHAEQNAILNRFSADLEGCTMYVTRIPCSRCAGVIIQSGIKFVFYMSDYGKSDTAKVIASNRMFNAAGVTCDEYKPSHAGLRLSFTDVEDQEIITSRG